MFYKYDDKCMIEKYNIKLKNETCYDILVKICGVLECSMDDIMDIFPE